MHLRAQSPEPQGDAVGRIWIRLHRFRLHHLPVHSEYPADKHTQRFQGVQEICGNKHLVLNCRAGFQCHVVPVVGAEGFDDKCRDIPERGAVRDDIPMP